jgi:cytochrome c-type biogenesis protein CcmH
MRAIAVLVAALVLLPLSGLLAQPQGEGLGLDAPKVLEAPAGKPLSGEELDQRTEEVSSLMRCPVCQGLSVADSPTDSAIAMKQEVRDLLALGYSEEQILVYFESSYGEFIRLAPKPEGFNLVVWIAPVLALLGGGGLIVAYLRRRGAPVEAAAEEESPSEEEADADPELAAYLERVRDEAKG